MTAVVSFPRALSGALRSHDVTRVGQREHHRSTRKPCASGHGCVRTGERDRERGGGKERERKGRDSFEPRLVFASPCVPRTSYFNETVCSAPSLSPLPYSSRLSSSLALFLSPSRSRTTDRPTSRLSFSLFLYLYHSLSPPLPPWSLVSSDFVSLSVRLSLPSPPLSLSLISCLYAFFFPTLRVSVPARPFGAPIEKSVAPPSY